MLGRQISGQRIEVVADHLGADILTGREPSQAGRMLKRQAMLEALERLLDAPAAMIKLGEGGRGIPGVVEQGRHEHAHLTVRRHLADQAHGRSLTRTLIIDGIAAIRWRQGHHRVVLAGAHELCDRDKGRRRVAAHAERNSPMQQGCHQPRPRVASIEYQHVLSAKPVQALEQHLPLADLWAVQNQRIEQLDTRTKQTEQCRFAHTALALGVEQRQANLRRIRCQHPQPLPARLIGKRFINQPQQLRVEWIEDIRKEAATCLRERAGGDPSRQAGSPRQQREECIEFALNGTAHTAKQESDQIGEGQATRTREIPGVAASRFEKGGALDEVRKPRKYVDIFRPSYLTYKYQSVTRSYCNPVPPFCRSVRQICKSAKSRGLGSPSPLRARNPPSCAISRTTSRTEGGCLGGFFLLST